MQDKWNINLRANSVQALDAQSRVGLLLLALRRGDCADVQKERGRYLLSHGYKCVQQIWIVEDIGTL